MEKKYQIFISSTYEDLIVERQKAIDTILAMNQFPVGMEMFSAADEEQWEIIKQTIDCSDFYVLIVGNKYGSVIPDGMPDAGISYTEKEFKYALEKKIPILAFIVAPGVIPTVDKAETDPVKVEALKLFKEKVKKDRLVKFWKNPDELSAQLSQSIYKAILRGSRPGWVRTTDFDIEKSHAEIIRLTERVHTLEALNADLKLQNIRKPHLWISAVNDIDDDTGEIRDRDILRIENGVVSYSVRPVNISDARNGLKYKDRMGEERYAPAEEVRLFRYICKNAFSLLFHIHNDGNARATGVRVIWKFPNNLMVLSKTELEEYMREDDITFAPDAYENWHERFYEKEDCKMTEGTDKFVSIDELVAIDDIADLLDPAENDGMCSIFPGEVKLELEEIKHKDSTFYRGLYILPLSAGKYEIDCIILCNEFPEEVHQKIQVYIK